MDEYMVVLPEAHPLCAKEKIEIAASKSVKFKASKA